MIKSLVLSILMLLGLVFSMNAQQMPFTNEAVRLCQDKKYDAALAKIEEAKQHQEELDNAYLWYVDGFIHKEIFKQNELSNRKSKHRELATESFLKSLEMDKLNQHSSMTKLSLKFIASSYYNDALMQTREFVSESEGEPSASFARFKKLMHYAEPGSSLKKFDIEFYKSMGQRYFQLWQMDIENVSLAEKSVDYYNDVVRQDTTDSDAYYNIAVVFYNRAVFKYRKIGPDTDIFDLIVIQQECADLIKGKALINMNTAYAISPERGDVVRGLMYIHRALEHENDVEYFKKEIERLVNEGKLKLPDK